MKGDVMRVNLPIVEECERRWKNRVKEFLVEI